MSIINASLAKHVLVRQEGDDYFLFNRRNDGLIKVSNSILTSLTSGQLQDTETNRQITTFLSQNNMLESAIEQVAAKPEISKERRLYSPLMWVHSALNPINLLWAITTRCNMKCSYCFPDVNSIQPTFITLGAEKLNQIADQIIDAKILQVAISGGEALLEKYVWDIIEKLYKNNVKVGINTNGTTITEKVIQKLKKYEVRVGISIDAPTEEINAITRGERFFSKTVKGIKALIKANVPTSALVTISRYNFPCLEEHIDFIHKELGIQGIVLQDLRSFGTKETYDNTRLTPEQESNLYPVVEKIVNKYPKLNFNFTELFIFPHEKFKSEKNGKIMQCPAGYNLAYIDYYADMYPCTQLQMMKLGNVLKDGSITDLWQNSKMIKRLRELKEEPLENISGCIGCSKKKHCYGGCRGDAVFNGQGMYGLASRCPKLLGQTCSDE